jgi:methanethiol oxidase
LVAFDRAAELPDALAVVDVDESSDGYGTVVGWADVPTTGDERTKSGGTPAPAR